MTPYRTPAAPTAPDPPLRLRTVLVGALVGVATVAAAYGLVCAAECAAVRLCDDRRKPLFPIEAP